MFMLLGWFMLLGCLDGELDDEEDDKHRNPILRHLNKVLVTVLHGTVLVFLIHVLDSTNHVL